MSYVAAALIGLGNGVTAGAASVLFVTVLNIVPHLLQIAGLREKLRLMSWCVPAGAFAAALVYAFDIRLALGDVAAALSGVFFGAFVGVFLCALAETIDLLPIISKKLHLKSLIRCVGLALAAGKVTGALLYFLLPIWP